MSYAELAERLEAIGVKGITSGMISNKIDRGSFSAVFFLSAWTRSACRTFI